MCKPIRLAGLVNDSITDGPGLRFTVFVQGCPRRCEGCHNPTALGFEGGYDAAPEEIFEKIKKNPLLSGVTFSGGEPFSQAAALLPLARLVRGAGMELAVYTGFLMEELLSGGDQDQLALLGLADVVVDGPFVLSRRNLDLHFRGSDNQRILNAPETLRQGVPVLETSPRWNG